MAVDKGGLRYPIKATDEYTAAFKGFNKAIDTARQKLAALGKTSESVARQNEALKKSFASLSKDTAATVRNINAVTKATRSTISVNKTLVKISKDRAAALRTEAAAQTKLVQANTRFTQSLRNRIRDESTLLGITQRLATAAKALTAETAKRIRENRVESATIRQKVKLLERELTLKRQLAGLKNVFTSTAQAAPTRAQAANAAVTGQSTGQATRGVKTLNQNLKETESIANRISFTFRRLFGILAAFAAVRALISGFRAVVVEGIRFAARIEDAKLGIASLLIAVGDVNDATGATADTADRLALAQKEAAKQTELLRKDALETSATFDQLLETFQVALAPGFTAGLAVDQIRKFTVQISQAAQAIGLPQNQLAEEIRSILSGTIQARTTRIAVSLGITNEDIRRAKEAGKVFEFLQAKFKTFEVAGQESLKNFNVILSNVRDGLLGIIAAGFTGTQSIPGFFDTLKNELTAIDKLLKDSSSNTLEFNPELIAIVRAIGNGLRDAVIQARLLVQNLGTARILTIATAIGNAFSFAATAASILAEALTRNVALLSQAANFAARLTSSITGIATDQVESGFRNVLVILIQLASASTLLGLTFKGLGLGLRGIKALLIGIYALVGRLVAPVIVIVTQLGGIGATLAALKAGVLAILLPFTTIVGTVGVILGLLFLWEASTKAIIKATTGLELSFTGIAKILGNQILSGLNKATLLAEKYFLIFRRGNSFTKAQFDNFTAQIEKIDRQLEAVNNFQTINLNRIIDEDAKSGKSLKQVIKDIGQAASDGFSAAFGQIKGTTSEAKKFSDVLKNLPPIITNIIKPLDSTNESVKDLTDNVIAAKDELGITEATLNTTAEAAEQVKIALESQIEIRKASQEIEKQELQNQQALADALSLRVQATKTLNAQEEKLKLKVQGLLDLAEKERIQKDLINKIEQERNNEIAQLTIETDDKKKVALNQKIALLNKQLGFEQSILAVTQDTADAFNKNLKPEEFDRISKIVQDLLKAKGVEAISTQNLNQLADQRLQIEEQILAIAKDQIEAQALLAATRQKTENKELRAEIEQARAQNAESDSKPLEFVSPEEAKVIQTEINLLLTKQQILTENARIEQENIRLLLAAAERKGGAEDSTAIALKEQLAVSIQNVALQEELLAEEVQKLNDKIKLQAELAEASPLETIAIGAREAFLQVAEEVENTFLIIKDLIVDVINSTSQFIADAIVEAFDPTNKQSLREKFARFLQQIAKDIIAVLVKIAIVKAVLGLGTLLGGGAATGGEVGKDVGLRKGGKVPRRGKASPAHYLAPQGRAEGGHGVRPRGLDPRDTVPIWTQPGEFIIKRSSVLQYGADVMRQINEGLIDPATLRALSTANRVHSGSRRHARGFAEGGVITPSLRNREQTQPQGVGVATIISNEKEFDRLLAGGDKTLIRWIGKNRNKIKPLLLSERR